MSINATTATTHTAAVMQEISPTVFMAFAVFAGSFGGLGT